jgi:hypothetical protein
MLRDAIQNLEKTTERLSRRMGRLNKVLLALTVVNAALTAVLVYKEF